MRQENDKEKFKKEFIKRLIRLTVDMVRFCGQLKSNSLLWEIVHQLIDAVSSIGANVVEAQASSSRRDFSHFFQIALKSSNEVKYWLLVLRELCPEHRQTVDRFLTEVIEVSNVIGSSILTMKNKR